jgi:hypothetical protein
LSSIPIKLSSEYSKIIEMENNTGIDKHVNASYKNKGSAGEIKYFC